MPAMTHLQARPSPAENPLAQLAESYPEAFALAAAADSQTGLTLRECTRVALPPPGSCAAAANRQSPVAEHLHGPNRAKA